MAFVGQTAFPSAQFASFVLIIHKRPENSFEETERIEEELLSEKEKEKAKIKRNPIRFQFLLFPFFAATFLA